MCLKILFNLLWIKYSLNVNAIQFFQYIYSSLKRDFLWLLSCFSPSPASSSSSSFSPLSPCHKAQYMHCTGISMHTEFKFAVQPHDFTVHPGGTDQIYRYPEARLMRRFRLSFHLYLSLSQLQYVIMPNVYALYVSILC